MLKIKNKSLPLGFTLRKKLKHKIFDFIYIYLTIPAIVVSISLNYFSKLNNLEEKSIQEMTRIMTDYVNFIADAESSPQKPYPLYSTDEYGHFAAHLNQFKKWIEDIKQENRVLAHALKELETDKIFTDEVLFSFLNMIEKKKALEKFAPFFDETAKRIEDMHAEYLTWMGSSPEIKGNFLKGFVTGFCNLPEESTFLRQESYRITKSFIQECIQFLEFLSGIYGSYGKGPEGQIVFANDSDLQTFENHFEIFKKLAQEEENHSLALQERSRLTAESFPLTNEPKSDLLDQIVASFKKGLVDTDQAFAEADLGNIFTEEMLYDLGKIHEKKKKLEQLCVVLDTIEQNLEEQIPNLVQQMLSSTHVTNLARKKVEILNEAISVGIKRWLGIKRKYVLEFIKLIDFLSMRYGTYGLNENHALDFSYEIETKLCESYLNNINKFYNEEEETAAVIQECMQNLSK